MPSSLDNIEVVAAALESVPTRFVFAGAGILPLLVEPEFAQDLHPTEDTDAVVQVLHIGEWLRLRDALLACGFRERAMIHESRQILFWLGDLPVDFIPPRLREFGTANRWLDLGFEFAEESQLPSGRVIERLPASAFLASKIAAFLSRGRQDVLRSDDLDDIAALLVGRPTLPEEMSYAHSEIRAYMSEHFEAFRHDREVWDALPGYARSREQLGQLLDAFERVTAAVRK
jgi:hypothetical protein